MLPTARIAKDTQGSTKGRFLQYAAPAFRRRHWARRIARFLVVIAMISSAWQWGPRAFVQIGYLRAQHRCMTYAPPVSEVVFESDPDAAALLAERCQEYHLASLYSAFGRGAPFSHWRPPASHRPKALDKLIPKFGFYGTAFMHAMRTPAGNERLVIISMGYGASVELNGYGLGMGAHVYTPASWRLGSAMLLTSEEGGLSLRYMPLENRLRIFAGQIDPSDSSHFTVPYELNGKPGVIEGRLRDDESVTMSVGSGPAETW
jgi:hypothetical protein